jgi:hypothetical protein
MRLDVIALLGIVGANGSAIGTIHHESPADRRTAFVNPAVHVGAIHGDAPAFFVFGHDENPVFQMRREMRWNVVFGLQDNRQAATDSLTPRAMGCFCRASGIGFHDHEHSQRAIPQTKWGGNVKRERGKRSAGDRVERMN